MKKRILFGSILVIISFLLLPSIGAIRTNSRSVNNIHLEYLKNMQTLDFNQVTNFFIDLAEKYPLVQKEIIDQMGEIENHETKDLTYLLNSNHSFVEKVWFLIFNYRGFRFSISLFLASHFHSKITLMRALSWGIKLLRWVKVGIFLGFIDPLPDDVQKTPTIDFDMDNDDGTLTVILVDPAEVFWEDIDQIGSGSCDPFPTGEVQAGDMITNCEGIIRLRYIPTDEVIGVYVFD